MRTNGQCFQQTPNTLNATLQLKNSEARKVMRRPLIADRIARPSTSKAMVDYSGPIATSFENFPELHARTSAP
jgi:hypothetical protein